MRFKTLLLGSAAVIASAAAAQAADLSVAEPVDYVRVCDAFGEGYWYIPGTDTCISVSGKVEVGIYFGDTTAPSDNDWAWYTSTDLVVEAKSMTDWGPLTAYIAMTGKHGEYDESLYEVDEAYIGLGPMLLGYTDSLIDGGAGFTDDGLDLSNKDLNQLTFSWAFNGFGFAVSIEDPNDRYGWAADSMPGLSAQLSGEAAGWEGDITVLYAPNDIDDTLAVLADVQTEIGMWEFSLAGLWVDGEGVRSSFGTTGEGWAVNVSSQQNWQSNFYTAQTFAWLDLDYISSDWGAEFTIGYSPVDSLWFVANAVSEDEGDNWDFLIYAERTFGPNG